MSKLSFKKSFYVILLSLMSACSTQKPPVTKPTPKPIYPKPPSETQRRGGDYSSSILTGEYANSFELQNFIRYMVEKYGFSEGYLNALFSQAAHLDSVARLEEEAGIERAATRPSPGSWSRYRKKFLDEAHINNGVEFWFANADALNKASKTYGVDPEYIVAIIGVETYYGRNVGKTSVFDALTTLAFHTVRRSQFFTDELEHFLLMTREEGYDPYEIVGSWAGAMGLGQFMPSSFRKLAIDFNQDGKRDLWYPEDAIGSVANYFAKNGWQFHQPVAEPNAAFEDSSTVELSTYSGSEFWYVYPNFKVIKTYNNSNKYAMAVHQLAQACKQRYYESGGY